MANLMDPRPSGQGFSHAAQTFGFGPQTSGVDPLRALEIILAGLFQIVEGAVQVQHFGLEAM